jgi:hypothetical protein
MLRNSLILFGMLVIWVVVTIWYQFFRALRYPAIVEVLSRFFPEWIAIHDRLIFYSSISSIVWIARAQIAQLSVVRRIRRDDFLVDPLS